MRVVAYFAGWLLALPGLFFAGAILAVQRAIDLGDLFLILWDAVTAFAYGLPLAALVALALLILGFFRTGRLIGAGVLLIASLGALAVMLEGFGSPQGVDEAITLLPTVGAAALAGWLLQAEAREAPSSHRTPPGGLTR